MAAAKDTHVATSFAAPGVNGLRLCSQCRNARPIASAATGKCYPCTAGN